MVELLPSSATRNIVVEELQVGTTLTISAPSSVTQGASFVISGIFIMNDTGGPVPNATISLSYDGTSLGSATTGVDGDYLKTVSIPSVGSFTLRADYAGGGGFAGSEAFRNVSIGDVAVSSMLLISVAVGGIIAYLTRRFL